MCNCEHADHFDAGAGHPYMGVPAGLARAMYVGAVCDDCASTCMADYLDEESNFGY